MVGLPSVVSQLGLSTAASTFKQCAYLLELSLDSRIA